MTTSSFNPSDWGYVADPMGRLGQGYYKNKNNSQTLSVAQFEQKRRQPTEIKRSEEKEQIVNKIPSSPSPAAAQGGDGSALSPKDLTPWDNPIVGEELVKSDKSGAIKAKAPQKTSGESAQAQAERKKKEEEERRKRQQQDVGSEGGPGDAGEPSAALGLGGVGGGGNGDGPKVICTELVRQKLMRERDRTVCTLYALKRLPPTFMDGYHFWAIPYVRLMRRSTWATRLVVPFVQHRTREVRFRLALSKKGSWFGKVICAVHDPLCSVLGLFVTPGNFQQLYNGEAGKQSV
ncbi:hypothetical protein [Terasakiella sp. SH-1]|uniref:hypothetical protein n=1 Tax=Terasakiella sp. SH-1 TaxID=2560057 RepID=UPI0010734A73|nr:hypothetical protein [Terasakiella sp. SH-1]